nr:MAG TPA: hypothetical protein [Caudoviricetes sp.]
MQGLLYLPICRMSTLFLLSGRINIPICRKRGHHGIRYDRNW